MDEKEVEDGLRAFISKIHDEAEDINKIGQPDSFEKYASYEELFRYWLTKTILSRDHKEIEHQKRYPHPNQRKKCDIVVENSLWIELKFCPFTIFSCEYSQNELIEDVLRLQSIKTDATQCLYCIIVVSPDGKIPRKIQKTKDNLQGILTKSPIILSERVGTGTGEYPNAEIKVLGWFW